MKLQVIIFRSIRLKLTHRGKIHDFEHFQTQSINFVIIFFIRQLVKKKNNNIHNQKFVLHMKPETAIQVLIPLARTHICSIVAFCI